jgi:hypothetical protein
MPGRRGKSTLKSTLKPLKPWSMYSLYHDAVSDLLEEHDFFFDFHRNNKTWHGVIDTFRNLPLCATVILKAILKER